MEKYLLEINLISAQGLKPPSTNLRRMQTYALAWVEPETKLRTRLDKNGGENPTWNDKFIFRVDSDFLNGDTSAVTIEIYAVGYLKDPLIGTVRFLLSNFLPATEIGTPFCTALQIRRPSGRCYGVFNIGAVVRNDSDEFSALTGGVSAIGYRDLMGEANRGRRRERRKGGGGGVLLSSVMKGNENSGFQSCENYCCDSPCFSDDADSTTSSSSATSTVLKDWNGVREIAENGLKSDAAGYICGLMFHKKIHLSPSDQNFKGSDVKNTIRAKNGLVKMGDK